MIKLSIFLRKRTGMSTEEFIAYHKNQHAALFLSITEVQLYVRRYVQSHVVPVSLPGFPDNYYDGITELWFDDAAAIGQVFGAPEYLRLVRPDEERFLALEECGFLISTENIVIS